MFRNVFPKNSFTSRKPFHFLLILPTHLITSKVESGSCWLQSLEVANSFETIPIRLKALFGVYQGLQVLTTSWTRSLASVHRGGGGHWKHWTLWMVLWTDINSLKTGSSELGEIRNVKQQGIIKTWNRFAFDLNWTKENVELLKHFKTVRRYACIAFGKSFSISFNCVLT